MGERIIENYELALIIMPAVAFIACLISVLKIISLAREQEHLNSAIVLVPLYKKRIAITFGTALLLAIAVLTVVLMCMYGYVIPLLCLLIAVCAILAQFIAMFLAKFAVLDSGVLLPYKFIEWSELYDYVIEDNTVMFTGNEYGQYTLSSTSIEMSFNVVDQKKLEQILAKNKIKHKVDLR